MRGHDVDAVVVDGIDPGALKGLKQSGLKVYRAGFDTIKENLGSFLEGSLTELKPEQACGRRRHQHRGHRNEDDFEFGCGF